jgi:hypothetical protein
MQTGRKYIDEQELLPILLKHGCVRRVSTIELTVLQPSGAGSFKVTLDAGSARVEDAKAEIIRTHAVDLNRYALHAITGHNVLRTLNDSDLCHAGEELALVERNENVDEGVLVWRTDPSASIVLSEGGLVAAKVADTSSNVTPGSRNNLNAPLIVHYY